MKNTYRSFAPWDPNNADFPYEKEWYLKRGYKIRARLDKENPDLVLLCKDLEDANNEVFLVNLESDNRQIDVWYKPKN